MPEVKILLDSCVWAGAKEVLTKSGYNVKWVGEFLNDPGDTAIIRLAFSEKRILVTLDKDFDELVVFRGEPHFGILRIVDQSATQHGSVIKIVIERFEMELAKGAIIPFESGRIRIRLED